MSKIERQNRIKRLIQSDHIGTQEEIKRHLQEGGISVTQTTLSRDPCEVDPLKLRNSLGKLYYSLSETPEVTFGANIRLYILEAACAGFMSVPCTNFGEVGVSANLADSDDIPGTPGTMASVGTLLVICKDEETAQAPERDLPTNL